MALTDPVMKYLPAGPKVPERGGRQITLQDLATHTSGLPRMPRTTTPSGKEIVWHNGGTGGFRSFIAYDRKAGTGVVALSTTSTAAGVDDIGMHLLDATSRRSRDTQSGVDVAL